MKPWTILGILLFWATPGLAQPFFGGGSVAFDPEVSTINSGALLDAQAVVSADRKYVTLNMRTTSQRLIQLVPFPVVGFVGGAPVGGPAGGGGGVGGGGGGAVSNAPANASPDAIDRAAKAWILNREGMYLVHPLK